MESVTFGDNKFCGPSVISAICGITTDEAAAVISSITGKKRITGVYERDLIKSFESLGYSCTKIHWIGSSVFSALMSIHGKDGLYIFMVPGHFIAIEQIGNHKFICDNATKTPIGVSNSARLGQRVVSLFKVVKNG